MSRPPLPVGTWGEVDVVTTTRGWTARARVRDFDGRTRQVARSGRTKGSARTALLDALAERTTPDTAELTPSTRLDVLMTKWLEDTGPDKSTNTRKRYREVIALHLSPGMGSLTIAETTVPAVDRYLRAVAEHTGQATAKHCRSVLSGAMSMAVQHGAARTNPVTQTKPVRAQKVEPRALTEAEVATVREAVRDWQNGLRPDGTKRQGRPPTQDLLNLVDIMLGTGARIGEILAVRWSEVDLTAGTMHITGTVIRTDAKPAVIERQSHPKNSTSRRRLFLPRFAVDALMLQSVEAPAANVGDLVFPSVAGTVRDPASVRKQLTKVLAPVGLGWVTPHTFRKTVATALERGADLSTAASQLGHSGTDTTRRHYVEQTHAGPDAREVLTSLLSPK